MNAPEISSVPLPRYGIRDDEMTRPCVVLFDWNGDDEATVRVERGPGDDDDEQEEAEEENDELEASVFGRSFRGVGRRPGAVALGVVLGFSVGIGVCALFAQGDAQASSQATASAR